MIEPLRRLRNASRLKELHPVIQRKVRAILSDLEGHGLRPRIQCAWRSPAEQRKCYLKGTSQVLWGFHCATTRDGKPDALAADILDDDRPCNETTQWLGLLHRAARAHGLEAPFDWDPCHVQAAGITITQARAGQRPA